ncbi:MAG: ribulose-phosphate 3-epimerase [Proteobacteria bacterium]|jgi:ribulose-phosphate 3-epimerase|nr:ribulose-phosphate 3-epimerase [Pseudomonadota bacterium]
MNPSAPPWICPSILAADFARLGEEVSDVLAAGADTIHFDVMDNHYVPNLSVGPLVLRALRKAGIDACIDVHLMVKPVDRLVEDFLAAGADYITVHPESTEHLHRTLSMITDGGAKAGLVFNPATPLSALEPVIDMLDLILIMSVNPGFGGQAFIPSSLDKLRQARHLIDASGRDIRLQIDGGIKIDNIGAAAAAGADAFVAGTAIFGADNYTDTISAMRDEIADA